MVNAHQRAHITRVVREMVGVDSTANVIHKDCRQSSIKEKESAIQAVLNTIAIIENPFNNQDSAEDAHTYNMCSGAIATSDVSADLLQSHAKGEQEFSKFVETRLMSDKINFFNRLPKLKLQTFSKMNQQKTVKVKGQDVIVRADRNLMVRMLVVAQTRAMDLCEVLCYELGHIPWAIAGVDGTWVTTAKSSLLEGKKNYLLQKIFDMTLHGQLMEWQSCKSSHLCLICLLI